MKLHFDDCFQSEDQKIKCGEAHFSKIGEAFDNPAKFKKETEAIIPKHKFILPPASSFW